MRQNAAVGLSRREWIAGVSLLEGLSGQETPRAAFSAEVNLVNVFATVRDHQGGIVRDLSQHDFEIYEDERRQIIRHFSAESNVPLRIGLAADVSGSMLRRISDERDAARRFFRQTLRPEQDRAFFLRFDHTVELLQGLTGEQRLLDRAADEMRRRAQWESSRLLARPPGDGRCRSSSSAICDAIFVCCERVLQRERGRKALILLSDGLDGGSCVPLRSAVEAAHRADTIVYTMLFLERSMPRDSRGSFPGRALMQQLAQRTGGRMFLPGIDGTAAKAFAAIEEDLRNQYSIAYVPDAPSPGFHQVRIAAKGYTVQAREGYYGN